MKLKNRFDRIKLWWFITSFRFCVSIGKARWAQKFFERIPLPVHAADENAFRYREKQLWGRYIGIHGKLRLFTWKGFFNALLKITAIGVVVFGLSLVHRNLTGEIDTLKSQLQGKSTTSPGENEKPEPPPLTGDSPVLDINRDPLFSNGEFYFPLTFKAGPAGSVYYAPGETFGSESRVLEDCRIALRLLNPDSSPLYYVYSPGQEIRGTWMKQSAVADLEATLKPGTGIMISLQNKLSHELRTEPRLESKPIRTIPDGATVEFIQFAPFTSISTKLVWGQVKYSMETEKCFIGWIVFFSYDKTWVKAEANSDTIEVTDKDGLTLRSESGNAPVQKENLTIIPYGAQVQFQKFASLPALLSGTRIRIQVQYAGTTTAGTRESEPYTVWVNAGSIKAKYIAPASKRRKKALMPAGKMKPIK